MSTNKSTTGSCGCCDGISVDIPALIYNRPGLSSVTYRIGDHPAFKNALKARLSGSGQNALKKLTTRDNSDFTIALFDAWAIVADILTFYQERIANEAYIKTTLERRSVLELSELLGYKLNSGVAASAYIAFNLEDTPGALTLSLDPGTADTISSINLESGIKIQSIPGPNESAQIFETSEAITARPEWNALIPRLRQNQTIAANAELFYLKGITSGCTVGDTILIELGGSYSLKRIVEVTTDTNEDTTCIKFNSSASIPTFSRPENLSLATIKEYAGNKELDQKTVEDILSKQWRTADLSVLLDIKQWAENEFIKAAKKTMTSNSGSLGSVYLFKRNAFVFGHNAVKEIKYKDNQLLPQAQWDEWKLDEKPGILYLEDGYDEVLAGGFISIQNKDVKLENASTYKIDSAEVMSRSAYGINGKTTQIKFTDTSAWWPPKTGKENVLEQIRGSKIYAQSEALELTNLPIEDLISGDAITLDGLFLGLQKGQKVIVSGEVKDPDGILKSELKELKEVYLENGYTVLQFTTALSHSYVRNTVKIYANVVLASHGETVQETLGNGDATKTFQSFTLKHTPLSYTSANTVSGTKSSLDIRVNDILWEEVESFYARGPNEKVYVTRLSNDSVTTVYFGDGVTGSRLPGGINNITAKYRKGLGTGGNLLKEQISQLLTQPLGVKGAINPMPSSGGADKENIANAKKNAPRSVLSLDRVVSLQDFEDYSRSFAGIEKAKATWSWKNQKRCIFITISGANGQVISKSDTVYKNLAQSLKNSGGIVKPVEIESYRPKYFTLEAKIKIDSRYNPETVLIDVEKNLRKEFSFEKREFGQDVTKSETLAIMHKVVGVIAIDLDYLYYSDENETDNTLLEAANATPGTTTTLSAELLTLDPRPVKLSILT